MTNKLKPCPFCGNDKIVIRKYTAVSGIHHYVQCDPIQGGCGAEIQARVGKKQAMEDWNRRIKEQ